MIVFKCKMCGGNIESVKGKRVAKCEYCGSKMTLPDPNDEKIVNLYNRANDFRLTNQFDKAYGVYETILEIDNREVEAHWGILLCKYGVEYIDDPETGEKVPTCHRTIPTSIFKDIEFKVIEENADDESLEVYKEEAQRIDEIQKGILEVSAKEDPYDIFICYKETDSKGERTHDSVIAQDIYEKLTGNGYKVFFSRMTLENKLGTEYEPYIYSALKSAKAMLVVGTTEENFNAVWVKNEWSRYLEMMKEDSTKALIPVYSKIDAYKLPEEFAMLQAQSMDKIGAIQDLVHGIEKIISESKMQGVSELEKFKQAMDEASNLGNGKYEVVVMKEKASVWYYGFVILLILGCVSVLFSGANTLVSIFSLKSEILTISILDFIRRVSVLSIIPFGMSAVLMFIALIMPLLGRKHYRKSKYVIVTAMFIQIVYMVSIARYGYIDLNIIPLFLQFIFWFVNPKWHIDSSLKLVMDKDGKNKTQESNDKLVKNFKEKDKKIVNIIYYIIVIAITLVLGGFTVYNLIIPNDNGRDKMVNQIKIISEYGIIYADENLRTPIAAAEKGEYYNVVDEIKAPSWKSYDVIYKIETNKGVQGYISSARAQKIYGKNDPLYGKTQTNDRDTNVLQIRVTTEFINLRKRTSVTSEIIGKVYEDEIYTVLDTIVERDRTWYKIRTTFGLEGYISDRYHDDITNKDSYYVERLEKQ